MAIDSRTTTEPRTRLYRLDVDQLFRMLDAGVLPDDNNVELLGGLLARKTTKNPPHSFTIIQVCKLIRAILPAHWTVREEKSVFLGRCWRPEPDLSVVLGPEDRYREIDPTAADIALLVEVADTSYTVDRGAKWRRYAASGVPVYWIIYLAARTVEVYAQPIGQGKSARYGESHVYALDHAVPVLLRDHLAGAIAVKDILP
ncbi:MAG: Uma2 family endonuclease [Isosphaeraceae bacterium]|nr:Uma2 family endonuclease [Isosphaeraceae bacterium]